MAQAILFTGWLGYRTFLCKTNKDKFSWKANVSLTLYQNLYLFSLFYSWNFFSQPTYATTRIMWNKIMADLQLLLLLDYFATEQRIRREKSLLTLIILAFAMEVLSYRTACAVLILVCFALISYILFQKFASLHSTIEELKKTTSQ